MSFHNTISGVIDVYDSKSYFDYKVMEFYSLHDKEGNTILSKDDRFKVSLNPNQGIDLLKAWLRDRGVELTNTLTNQYSFIMVGKNILVRGTYEVFKKGGEDCTSFEIQIHYVPYHQISQAFKVGSSSEVSISDIFSEYHISGITWAYRTSSGTRYNSMNIDREYTMKDYHYPYISCGLDHFFEDYLKASASMLLLLGDPGTGKTSFIREMIFRKNLNTLITYDHNLISDDTFFMDFLDSSIYDILILEDSDEILRARDLDKNPDISKYLNATDGLIKPKGKKIIFSTNIEDISEIDSAIKRPGRTYDIIKFRELYSDEISAICEEEGLSAEMDNPHGKMTLAELYNPKTDTTEEIEGKKFGFHPR